MYAYIRDKALEEDGYIDQLREAVEIKSISKNSKHLDEVNKIITWVGNKIKRLGERLAMKTNVTYHEIAKAQNKSNLRKLPRVLTGEIVNNKSLVTLLVYGYLDVYGLKKKHDYQYDPFTLVEKNGQLYGRGVSDSKGPIVAFLSAIDAIANLKQVLVHLDKDDEEKEMFRVNLKFIFEGMGERKSLGLSAFLNSVRYSDFLQNVDFVTSLCPAGIGHPPLFNYEIARKSIKAVYGPTSGRYLIREGGSIHVIDILQKITGKHVINFPIGPWDDHKHNSFWDEKLSTKHFIDGIKVYVTYILQIGNTI